MASKVICIAALVLVVYCWSGALAQSGCTTELTSLYPCLNYVSGNASSPSSTCCSQLAGVVRSQPSCLCLLLNGGASSVGLNVNQTLALGLPDKCNLQTPPASRCNGYAGNTPTPSASSPDGSPSSSSNQTPESPNAPSGTGTPAGGSKSVPTVDASSSAGSNVRSPFLVVGFLLLTASGVLSGAGF